MRQALVVLATFFISIAQAQINVLTFHNDNARTGQNIAEITLTPANVTSSSFGKLFVINVDGKVDAQPLFIGGLNIPGRGVTNVLFVMTEHGTAYALDADNGGPIWSTSLLKSGETTSDNRGCGQITPEIGISATPAISLTTGPHGTLYAVAMSKDNTAKYHQRLHALDITTGAEQFSGPVEVQATYPGTGDNSSGGIVVFDPKQYKARAGLLFQNGIIYIGWSSHCDIRPYTGWLTAYNSTTLAQVSVLNITPNGNGSAIWQSGAGLAGDTTGNFYFLAANGTFDTTLTAGGFPVSGDFGNAFMKITTTNNTLAVADYFNMFDTVNESNADQDLGSGGALVLPDMTGSDGQIKQLVVGAGKDRNIYLANRANMGKFNTSNNNNIYQVLQSGIGGPEFGMPAYWNGLLYYGGSGDAIRAFSFSNARLSTSPSSQTSTVFPYPGATPSVSSNGNANGIVWATENSSTAVLHAYSATNVSQELYNSNQAAGGRDHFGTGNKYITPMIANGKVYVGTTNGVAAFGLLGQPSAVSVLPNTGRGSAQTYSLTYSDSAAASNLSLASVLFNQVLSSVNSCYVIYSRSANAIYLVNDAGSGTVAGSLAPGASGSLTNSQCTVTGPVNVTLNGTNLTMTLPLTFKAAFPGQKTIYMLAGNVSGNNSGWQARGTWTTSDGQAPTTVVVNPSSGTGATQTFIATYADANLYTDLSAVYLLLNSSLNGANACLAAYIRSANQIYLYNDAGNGLVAGSLTPGTAGTIANSQCSISGTGSSASGSGNNLTVGFAITFQSAFPGVRTIYGLATDNEGMNSNWNTLGSWARSPDQSPSATSVIPSSGSGGSQTFTLTFMDSDGAADLSAVYGLFGATLNGANGCVIVYVRSVNAIYLYNDAGNALAGSVTPGAAGIVTNSQCTISSGGAIGGSGPTMTVPVAVTFKSPAFTGVKNLYMLAVDSSGQNSGWQLRGVWTVP